MNKLKKRLLPVLLALLLALVCELTLFNRNALLSSAEDDWVSLPAPSVSGNLAEEQTLALFFYHLDQDVRWCHIDLAVWNADGEAVTTDFTVNLADEGSAAFYRAGSIAYYPGHDKASYFRLNSYGAVHSLSLELHTGEPGCTWALRAAQINGRVPFRISVPRVLGLFALFCLLWALRPGSVVYDNRVWNRRRWSKPLCIVTILLIELSMLSALACSNKTFTQIPDDPRWAHHHQYALLARALAEGKTWIETPEQAEMLSVLSEMPNPYNASARSARFKELGITCAWDTAYYQNHLYVYFGVVPVLLTYLPYYLLTGSDLSTVYVVLLSGALAILAAFLFLRVLIRRFFSKTPFPVYVLLSLLLGSCTGVLYYAVDPSFYIVPFHFSLAFVFLALALWISASERWALTLCGAPVLAQDDCCFAPLPASQRSGSISLRIALGSLLAALVAGCRPQFLVFSALALPLFIPLLRQEPRRRRSLLRALAFALPYATAALPLMYYNNLRFGSPFDFGASYNLTTNDMPHRGFRLGRLPDGFFAYLLQLPNVTLPFPYLQATAFTPRYLGKTILEPMFGGVLPLFPFLWVLFGLRRASPVLREKGLRWIALLPLLLCLVVIVADTELAGILWRYVNDFQPLLFLSAALVFLACLQAAPAHGRARLLRFLVLTALLALAACLLISVANSRLAERDPALYFRIRDLLDIS